MQVCCPDFASGNVDSSFVFGNTSPRPPPPRPSSRPPSPVRPPGGGRPQLPARCGMTNATDLRIVGGEEAPPGERYFFLNTISNAKICIAQFYLQVLGPGLLFWDIKTK